MSRLLIDNLVSNLNNNYSQVYLNRQPETPVVPLIPSELLHQYRFIDVLQGADVGGLRYDEWCGPRLARLLPAKRAQTPAVTRLEPGKHPLRPGRGKIVAAGGSEGEKLLRHLGAHYMRTGVASASSAFIRPEYAASDPAAVKVAFLRGDRLTVYETPFHEAGVEA